MDTKDRLAELASRIQDKLKAQVVYHVGSKATPYLVRTIIETDVLLEFYILSGVRGVRQVERYCREVLGITTD